MKFRCGRIPLVSLCFVLLAGTLYSQTPGSMKWAYSTGNSARTCPAISTDGTLYFGSDDNRVYAVGLDGKLKWFFNTNDDVGSSPAIGPDGTIYVGSVDDKLYAITPGGVQKWSVTTGNMVYSSPAISADGTIYVGSVDNKLYAIDPNGVQKWIFTTQGPIYYSPAISVDGTVYVGSNDNKLYAINPNGTLKWSYTANDDMNSSPAIGSDGTVYIGSRDNRLYAINSDGTMKWYYTTGGDVYSSPAIGSDGTIYIGSYDAKFYAINPNGTMKWTFTAGNMILSSPAIGSDGTIFVGSHDMKLYAINPAGTQKWSFATGGNVSGPVAIGADGTIYFGSWDGKLYAVYSTCGGLASSDWPKFKGDVRNTGRVASIAANYQGRIAFLAPGQSYATSISLSNTTTDTVTINSCSLDNSEYALNTTLPLTLVPGGVGQLSVNVRVTAAKLYKSACSIQLFRNNQAETRALALAEGVFIDDNSELALAAHQALDAYNSCLAKDPASLATKNNLGILYRLLGEYDVAEQHLMAALSSSLNARYGYSGIRMNVGVVKSDKRTASDAFNFYSSSESDIATTASTSSLAPRLYYNQAWEYYNSKSFPQALTAINKAISHQSANNYLKAKAYVLRGSISYSSNDVVNAKKDMETAKSLDPNGPIGQMAEDNLVTINLTDVEKETDRETPTDFALLTNYPNPFNPTTTIRFDLPARSRVRLLVFDVTGREIRALVDEEREMGSYSIRWDGEDNTGRTVPSGVYLVRMSAGYFTQTQKMILLR